MRESENLEFRKIPSLKYLYEVNSNGTILRNVKSKKQCKIILDMRYAAGYYTTFVNMAEDSGMHKVKRVSIHRVVAECWHGPCPAGYQVDHCDRNSLNNDYHNLRYVTHSEQMRNRTLSPETIQRAIRNCQPYIKAISIPVLISVAETTYKQPSICQAAAFLAQLTGKSAEGIRYKLKKRRSNIYGYDISYLNAETVRHRPKGQETVQ